MKGVFGFVQCDHKECPQMFVDGKPSQAPFDRADASHEAERAALKEGWTISRVGTLRHFCPGHSQQRKEERQAKLDAALARIRKSKANFKA